MNYILIFITTFLIITFVDLFKTRLDGYKSLNPKEFIFLGILILFMILIIIKLFLKDLKK